MSAAATALPNLHAKLWCPQVPKHQSSEVKMLRIMMLLLPTLIGLVSGATLADPDAVKLILGGFLGLTAGLGIVAISDADHEVKAVARRLFAVAIGGFGWIFPYASGQPHLLFDFSLGGTALFACAMTGTALLLRSCYRCCSCAVDDDEKKQWKQCEQEEKYPFALAEFCKLDRLKRKADEQLAQYQPLDDLRDEYRRVRCHDEDLQSSLESARSASGKSGNDGWVEHVTTLNKGSQMEKFIEQTIKPRLTSSLSVDVARRYLATGMTGLPTYSDYQEAVFNVKAYNTDWTRTV